MICIFIFFICIILGCSSSQNTSEEKLYTADPLSVTEYETQETSESLQENAFQNDYLSEPSQSTDEDSMSKESLSEDAEILTEEILSNSDYVNIDEEVSASEPECYEDLPLISENEGTTETDISQIKPNTTQTDEIICNEEMPSEVSSNTYILNTNTKKFHYPDCSSVDRMKEKNKSEYTGTRDEIISMGYSPCGNCHP